MNHMLQLLVGHTLSAVVSVWAYAGMRHGSNGLLPASIAVHRGGIGHTQRSCTCSIVSTSTCMCVLLQVISRFKLPPALSVESSEYSQLQTSLLTIAEPGEILGCGESAQCWATVTAAVGFAPQMVKLTYPDCLIVEHLPGGMQGRVLR